MLVVRPIEKTRPIKLASASPFCEMIRLMAITKIAQVLNKILTRLPRNITFCPAGIQRRRGTCIKS
jgi:hypothetical protein